MPLLQELESLIEFWRIPIRL